MTLRLLSVCLAAILLVTGCGDDGDAVETSSVFVPLDGSPRLADDAGRLSEIAEDFSTITLDGDRTYDVDPRLQSFSALDGSIQPLIRWRNQYVQVGLDGDVVQWVGGVSAVVEVPGEDPVAYFTDVLIERDDERLTFRSGAVFDVGPDVVSPSAPPVAVVATIDVGTDLVVALEAG